MSLVTYDQRDDKDLGRGLGLGLLFLLTLCPIHIASMWHMATGEDNVLVEWAMHRSYGPRMVYYV